MKKAASVLGVFFFVGLQIRAEAQEGPAFPKDVEERADRLIQGGRMHPAEAQAILTALFAVERIKAEGRMLREKSHFEELAFPGTLTAAVALFLPYFVKPTFPYASIVMAGVRIGSAVLSYSIWHSLFQQWREYASEEKKILERLTIERQGLTQLLDQIDQRIGEEGP